MYNSSDGSRSLAVKVINGDYNLDVIVLDVNGKIRVSLNTDNGTLRKQTPFSARNDPWNRVVNEINDD